MKTSSPVVSKGSPSPRRAFSLVEILSVLTVITILTSFAVPAISGLGSAGRLSQAGNSVADIFSLARNMAMSHNSLTAVVVATDPASGVACRAVAVMELRSPQDNSTLSSSDWKQVTRWETFPPGVLVDTSSSSLLLNSHSEVAGTPGVPSPALPAPQYGAQAVEEYGYLVFLPNGSLLSGNSGGLRLVEGVKEDGREETIFTHPGSDGSPANYYQVTVLGSTGRTLISRQ